MTWERTSETTSGAEPARVWATLLDGRRWAAWWAGIEWMTVEGTPAPGTVLTMKPKGAPQTAFRIEAVEPQRVLGLVLTFGPVATMRLRWELAPHDGGTTIAETVAISGPLAGLLLKKTAVRIAEAMQSNLERLGERAASLQG